MTVIVESRPLKENVASVGAKKMRVRIIEGDRWGSSGYYSKEVLERDGPVAFPEGTQMYLDHPSESEERERPERSVRDLAGKLLSSAAWDNDGLYAEVEVYGHVAPVIAEMADDIGLSVRASAILSSGEAEGRTGPIVEKIIDGYSVDYVTQAGAGGKIVQIMESARKKIEEAVSDKAWADFSASDYDAAQWRRACLIDTGEGEEDSKSRYKLPVREPDGTVNRNGVHAAAGRLNQVEGISDEQKKSAATKLVSLYKNQLDEDPPESLTDMVGESSVKEATYYELYDALSSAVRSKYSGTSRYAYIRDFDEDMVWFEVYDPIEGKDRTFQQPWESTDDEKSAELTGEPSEVVAQTKYVPISSNREAKASREYTSVPGNPPAGRPTPTEESSMGDVTISESRLRELEESAKQVDPLKEQLTESQKETKDALVVGAKETKRANEAEARLVVRQLMEKAEVKGDKLAESLAKNPPLTEDGKVDEKVLAESVKETLSEVSAGISESHGGVRGFGAGEGAEKVSESDANKVIAGAFGREVSA